MIRSGSRSQLVGIVVLALAGSLLLVVPVLLTHGSAGSASADPRWIAPDVAACLTIADGGGSIEQVPCVDPHNAEVTTSWPLGHGPGDPNPKAGYPYGLVLMPDDCDDDATVYTGESLSADRPLWSPLPPLVTARMVWGPDGGPLHWTACVLGDPGGSTYTGTLRNANVDFSQPRPAPFTTCLALGELALRQLRYVACDQPHRIEMLGYFNTSPEMVARGTVEATVTQDQIAGECDVLTSHVMNTSDLGRLADLRVRSEALWRRSAVGGGSPGSTADQAGLIIPDCFVEYIGDGVLTGSVVGLGSRPLPVG